MDSKVCAINNNDSCILCTEEKVDKAYDGITCNRQDGSDFLYLTLHFLYATFCSKRT